MSIDNWVWASLSFFDKLLVSWTLYLTSRCPFWVSSHIHFRLQAFSTHVSSGAWDKTLIYRYLVKVFVTKLQLKINCFGWYAIFELTMQPPLNYSSVEVIFLWTFCHQFTFPSTKNFNLNPKLCQLILSLLSFSMSLAVISNRK